MLRSVRARPRLKLKPPAGPIEPSCGGQRVSLARASCTSASARLASTSTGCVRLGFGQSGWPGEGWRWLLVVPQCHWCVAVSQRRRALAEAPRARATLVAAPSSRRLVPASAGGGATERANSVSPLWPQCSSSSSGLRATGRRRASERTAADRSSGAKGNKRSQGGRARCAPALCTFVYLVHFWASYADRPDKIQPRRRYGQTISPIL